MNGIRYKNFQSHASEFMSLSTFVSTLLRYSCLYLGYHIHEFQLAEILVTLASWYAEWMPKKCFISSFSCTFFIRKNTKKISHCLESRLHFSLQELVYLAKALLIQSLEPPNKSHSILLDICTVIMLLVGWP